MLSFLQRRAGIFVFIRRNLQIILLLQSIENNH